MTTGGDDRGAAEVERLVGRLERSPDHEAIEEARALVRGVLAFHRDGLARVVEIARTENGPPGDRLLDRMAADPAVSALLVLHGLHPASIESRARAAVEKLRVTHTTLELVGVRGRTIQLRLARSGGVAPLVSKIIEAELAEAVPDALGVTFLEPDAPLVQLRRKEKTP